MSMINYHPETNLAGVITNLEAMRAGARHGDWTQAQPNPSNLQNALATACYIYGQCWSSFEARLTSNRIVIPSKKTLGRIEQLQKLRLPQAIADSTHSADIEVLGKTADSLITLAKQLMTIFN